MKRLIFNLSAVLGIGTMAAAEQTNTVASTDFLAFRIISERNIFNPNRYRGSASRPVRERERERRVRTEVFSLVGTMLYEKGRFAFFDGNGSEYRKVLQSDDLIAGFKVSSVAPTCVKLEGTNGQLLELCVGMQMKRREDEGWQLAGMALGSSGSESALKSSETGSEADDVLQRLKQRRDENGTPTAVDTNSESDPDPAEPKVESPSDAVTDPVLKKLLQKRELEINK